MGLVGVGYAGLGRRNRKKERQAGNRNAGIGKQLG